MSSKSKETIRGKAAVIGIGMSPVGQVPGKSPLWLAANAANKALADAGIGRDQVDGVLCGHAFAAPFHRFSVALSEYMGIRPTFSNPLQVSGATAATMFNIAAAAVNGGLAETVLIAGGVGLATGMAPGMARRSVAAARGPPFAT
ncbi:MAG TPA: hypothetical protein PKC22_08855, partial [Rhodocyclaceae bacterium]|nr:hypothetical protein [Rhodocyclaceae bacterium]